jgi:hypothetical protein
MQPTSAAVTWERARPRLWVLCAGGAVVAEVRPCADTLSAQGPHWWRLPATGREGAAPTRYAAQRAARHALEGL